MTDPRPIQMYLGTSVLLDRIQAMLRDTVAHDGLLHIWERRCGRQRTDWYCAEETEHHTDTVRARLVCEAAIQPMAYMRFSTRDSHWFGIPFVASGFASSKILYSVS